MLLILGVTASGKGKLAFDLAKSLNAEIISIDSMKVYRRMDIGTAKPPKDVRRQIKHHLIDFVEPGSSFSVARFLDLANQAIQEIKEKNKPVIAVGGTALYIKALLYGLFEGPGTNEHIRAQLRERIHTEGLDTLYNELTQIDPPATQRIHPNDQKRIIRALEVYQLTGRPISQFQNQWHDRDTQACPACPERSRGERPVVSEPVLSVVERAEPSRRNAIRTTRCDWTIIGLRRAKTEENKRINARVRKMIQAGLLDEVNSLLAEDKPLSPQARCAIGYAEVIDHLAGRTTLNDTVELIKKNTRRLAKSQRTWFKTFPNVNWLDLPPNEPAEDLAAQALKLVNNLPG